MAPAIPGTHCGRGANREVSILVTDGPAEARDAAGLAATTAMADGGAGRGDGGMTSTSAAGVGSDGGAGASFC
jgi:hypothetical protein